MNPIFTETLQSLRNSRPMELPAFNQAAVLKAKQDIDRLESEAITLNRLKKSGTVTDEAQISFITGRTALLYDEIYRIKRFMLIYFSTRLDRVESQFWEYGGNIAQSDRDNLSQPEKNYLNSFKGLINEYIDEVKVDLTTDLRPPLNVFVEYRVLQDCGEILDERGQSIRLEKDSCGYIPLKLIESFVEQGFIKIKTK